ERLSKQGPRHFRKVGAECGAFDQPTAQRIGNAHATRPRREHQAGDSQVRILSQLEWIAQSVWHPAQDHIDALESAQGFQEDLLATHCQIASLHQLNPLVARQISMLERALVEDPWGEQYDSGQAVIT